LSVEQPNGSTPTPGWARSEPAGYPQPPDPVPVGDEPAPGQPAVGDPAGQPAVSDLAGPEPAADEAVVSEATTGSSEGGPDSEVGTVKRPDVETSDVAAASDGRPTVDTGVVDEADLSVADRVRRQVAALDGLAALPLSEHARRYDEVHAELQAALTEIDGESS